MRAKHVVNSGGEPQLLATIIKETARRRPSTGFDINNGRVRQWANNCGMSATVRMRGIK